MHTRCNSTYEKVLVELQGEVWIDGCDGLLRLLKLMIVGLPIVMIFILGVVSNVFWLGDHLRGVSDCRRFPC